MFRDLLPDYDWHLNTVTPMFAIQVDGYSCDLFTLANFAGKGVGFYPSSMDQDYIKKSRIFIFCKLCPNTIRSNGKPWKYKLPPLAAFVRVISPEQGAAQIAQVAFNRRDA
jgi:hypothetical protein